MGFPSPAEDYIEPDLCLDTFLVHNRPATCFMRAKGCAMTPLINPGDIMVVDRSASASNNNIVIVVYEGRLVIRRLLHRCLVADSGVHEAINLDGLTIFGVVTSVIRILR